MEHTLSLTTAILINLNIMLGAGIFINTTLLSHYAGALGSLSYALMGCLMLPLILCMATLLRLFPGGSFYTFGTKSLNSFFGFFGAWSYFVGKLGSATLMIHASVLLLQKIIPALAAIPALTLDGALLGLFIFLNMKNLKTGSHIQTLFTVMKSIPLLFVILVGAWFVSGANYAPLHQLWDGIPATLPLVLYGTMGFEGAILLSSKIKDSKKNAPRAVLISYGLVILIAVLYQTIFYGAVGNLLGMSTDFRIAFPSLFARIFPANISLQQTLSSFMHLAIASSALGGAYGIIFSNNWNIYAIAQHHHVFFSKKLITLNQNNIPWLCVLLEGIVCALYLAITQGSQLALQQMAALGVVITYTISVASLFFIKKQNPTMQTSWVLPILGLANCAIMIKSCLFGLVNKGMSGLIIYALLLGIGFVMYFMTKNTTATSM